MGITHIPQQVAATVQDAAAKVIDDGWDKNWVRTVAAGSLVTGALLLATGNRKAGLAVAAAGTAFALLEDPAGAKKVWNHLPDYLEKGHGMLGRVEQFVGELTSQGEKLKDLMQKAVRQA